MHSLIDAVLFFCDTESTVSSQLAWTLAHQGYNVGILDIDIWCV